MTARAAALPVLVLAAVCIVVWRIMQTSIFWGIFTACAIAAALFLRACMVLIGGSRGAHAAPRRYVLDDDMPTAVIPRVATEHDPPWDGEHITEPTAIMPAPVPVPEPEAYWIAAGTVSDGRVRLDHVAVLPPPVEAILGHRTVDEALDSMFNRAMARQVRALTDGAP